MNFIVDGMLGGLARWLRILGHSALYDSKFSDQTLLARAAEGITLLTRDEELCKRALAKNLPVLLVSGQTESERLAQLSRSLGITLTIDIEKTLCPKCGSRLRYVSKEEVSGIVPVTSLRVYDRFWRCASSSCGKAYWMGSHWKQINQTLILARKLAGLEQ